MPDREKVIKGLAEISEYARAKADIAGIGKGKEVFDSWYRAAEDALALLREQEAVEPTVSGWISVKDRLPEATEPDVHGDIVFSKMVLVHLGYDNGFSWITVDKCNVKQNAWLHEVPGDGCRVTHWMPLPEPPEEVRGDASEAE